MRILILNRSRALLGLGATLALGLSGCNGDDDGAPSSPTPAPSLTPSATVAPTAAVTPTPVSSLFSGVYTGTYRATQTSEVGTFLFTVASDGTLSGSFASPFSPEPSAITGTVSGTGALRASGLFGSGAQAPRISITATLRNVGSTSVVNGTFTSTSSRGSVSGTATGRKGSGQSSIYNGSYTGSFVNTANTSQNGTVSATVSGPRIIATIQVPGVGPIQGRGLLDLTTGQFTLSAPFALPGNGGSTAQFFGLTGRFTRSGLDGSGIVGVGTFGSSAGGQGTFRVNRISANR